MRTLIDPGRREIDAGGRKFPFRLDCREDSAAVEVDGRAYRVGPLRWRAKLTLARYARHPELLEEQFVRACAQSPLPDELQPVDLDVLLTLARWMNETAEMPLDLRELTNATMQLCRATQLRPADFDAMPAMEVEAMWSAIAATPSGAFNAEEAGSAPETAFSEGSSTKILIVPDHQPENAAKAPTPDAAVPSRPVERSPAANPSEVPAGTPTHRQTASSRALRFRVSTGAERQETALQQDLRAEQAGGTREHGASIVARMEGTLAPAIGRQPTLLALSDPPRFAGRGDSGPRALQAARHDDITPAFQPETPAITPAAPRFVHRTAPLPEPLQVEPSQLEPQRGEVPLLDALTPAHRDVLFEDFADRLEQAVADMGIGES